MEIVFWSPFQEGQTAKNMSILANILRIQYKEKVYTFHDYQKVFPRIEQLKKEKGAYIFWNCEHYFDCFVEKLFQRADVVMVNLPQDEKAIASCFQEHYKIKGKVFYLVSNDPASGMDCGVLCRKVFRLREEEYGTIPYNLRFEQYYEKKKGFFYQKRLLNGVNYGVEDEFEKKTREIAVKVRKMNCLLQEDTLYYSISKGE